MGLDVYAIADHYRICTSSTRPSGIDVYEGLMIYETDTGKVQVRKGSGWKVVAHTGAWDTYTPDIWNNGGSPVSKTVVHARYRRIGNECSVNVRANITSAGITGAICISLPVAVEASSGILGGNFHFYDASTNIAYAGTPFTLNSTSIYGVQNQQASNSSLNMALANGDVLWINVTYETADA